MKSTLLAGDIGGTKTTLAIVNIEQGTPEILVKSTYPSATYESLEALVDEFLAGKSWTIIRASFGVAGPVVEGRCQVTNLPWLMDEVTLSAHLGIPVCLLNDLTAIAYAVPLLKGSDLAVLNEGKAVSHGALGVIAPGTGLGEAYLLWNGISASYEAFSSEGGHTDFGPTDEIQMRMLGFLFDRFGHISYERVCSGMGLPNIYTFLKECRIYPEPSWLCKQIESNPDPTPVISQAAMDGRAEIAVATLDIFTSILGSEAGNLALKVMATGGIFIGGGIPPRILPFLQKDIFMKSFIDKGRFSELLINIPIKVILNPEVALVGAAEHGFEQEMHDV